MRYEGEYRGARSPRTFSLFPRFKNQFLRECNRWGTSCHVYSLVTLASSRLFRRFVVPSIPIFASGPFHFSRFLLCRIRGYRPIRSEESGDSPSFASLYHALYNCRHLY